MIFFVSVSLFLFFSSVWFHILFFVLHFLLRIFHGKPVPQGVYHACTLLTSLMNCVLRHASWHLLSIRYNNSHLNTWGYRYNIEALFFKYKEFSFARESTFYFPFLSCFFFEKLKECEICFSIYSLGLESDFDCSIGKRLDILITPRTWSELDFEKR